MKTPLERLLAGIHLTEAEAEALVMTMTDASASPIRAAGILTALRLKGETPQEVRGFARGMRRLAVRPDLTTAGGVDIVGTGGDGSGSLNLSTGAALLTAACGVPVIKHGNRSISSQCGSADVLEELGYVLPTDGTLAGRDLARHGFTFLFAPYFHPAMKRMAPVRRELRIRTIFNILGPLTNPALPPFAVIGACDRATAHLLAETLAGMPIERALVVHGAPGWDEATPVGPFLALTVSGHTVTEEERDPSSTYGIPRCHPEDLTGRDAVYNARRIRMALEGEPGPCQDALMLGTALALETAGRAPTPDVARNLAENAIASGAARRLLRDLSSGQTVQRRHPRAEHV